jgi:hypothetical protein
MEPKNFVYQNNEGDVSLDLESSAKKMQLGKQFYK